MSYKSSRSPAQTDINYRIASYTVSASEKFVLLGVPIEKSFFKSDTDATELCRPSFCFHGDDLKDFSPRYLIHFKDSQLSKIYTFSQENEKLNYRRIRKNIRRSRRVFESMKRDPAKTPSYPLELVDVESPKNYPFLRMIKYLVYSSFPVIGPTLVASERFDNEKLIGDISYLERLLKDIKNSSSQKYHEHLREEDITDVLISLLVQYHPDGNVSGLAAKRDPIQRRIQYETFLANKEAKRLKNYAQIIDWANRTQTLIFPFSERFALVTLDKSENVKEELLDRQKNLLGLDLSFDFKKSLPKDSMNELTPIGIIDFYHGDRPLDVMDFGNAEIYRNQKKAVELIDFFSQTSVQFIPLPFVQIALDLSQTSLKFVIRKQGKTLVEDRVRSFGELMALFQLGAIDHPTKKLLSKLEDFGLNEDIERGLMEKVENEKIYKTHNEGAIERNILRFAAKIEQKHLQDEEDLTYENLEDETISPSSDHLIENLVETLSLKANKQELKNRPVILFLVDGLSQSKLKYGLDNDLLPTIQEVFAQNGRFFETYTSRSITLPSWMTVLSGLEPDEHGTRSNSPIRTTSNTQQENMIDFRKELILPNAIATSRSLQRLREAGADWLPSYLPPGETIVNFMPLNDKNYPPVFSLTQNALKNFQDLLFGSFQSTDLLDSTSAELSANEIKKRPGKHRLVINWYASVDHHAHKANAHFRLLRNAKVNNPLFVIDQSIRKVLMAAKDDPVLKDAVVFLISDHGQTGHHHHSNSTSFNLVRFFAGDYPEKSQMDFVTQSASSPDPDFDISFLHEFFIQPFRAIYPKDERRKGRSPNMLIDYSGDRYAQVYLKQGEWSLNQRMNLYELTHHSLGNMYDHLLDFQLNNQEVLIVDQRPVQKHPVLFMGQSLSDKISLRELDKWLKSQNLAVDYERDPVILKTRENKTALIFSKRDSQGEDLFRYIVVSNFSQDRYGRFWGRLAQENSSDPFHYKLSFDERNTWRTDREWLKILKNEKYPTGLFSVVRSQTLAPRLQNLVDSPWQAETPDFFLVANDEYSFNSSLHMEADHGGLLREEVQTVLGVGSLNPKTIQKDQLQPYPFLLRDITPTVLDILGLGESNLFNSGKSFAPLIL